MKKILLSAIATVALSSDMTQAAATDTIAFNGKLTACSGSHKTRTAMYEGNSDVPTSLVAAIRNFYI